MVILRTRNKIPDFLMILAWASPFKVKVLIKPLFTLTFLGQHRGLFVLGNNNNDCGAVSDRWFEPHSGMGLYVNKGDLETTFNIVHE